MVTVKSLDDQGTVITTRSLRAYSSGARQITRPDGEKS
jgi:hypothetical protein